MNHKLKLWEVQNLYQVNEHGKRWYVIPTGEKYVSVTTALSVLSKKGIAKWRQKVGEDEANKISGKASRLGKTLHNIAEDYMLGEDSWNQYDPISVSNFLTLKSQIDKNIGEVYGVELPMCSHEYKVAGTSDLICQWNGVNTILDFKTSLRQKTREHITGYFIQAATYAQMAEEMYGWKAEQIVILMAVHDDNPQVFVEPVERYKKLAENFFKFYHKGLL